MVINAMNIARYIPAPGLPLISTPHSHHNSTTPVSLSLPAPHCPTELQPVLTLLSSIPSFQALARSYSSAILTLFAAQMRPEHLNISDYLFHTDEIITKCYIVLKGAIKLQGTNQSVRAGGCLGDQGLLATAKWTDTAVVSEECDLIVLLKSDFEEVVNALKARENVDLSEILRLFPTFRELSTLQRLAKAIITREYRRGQYVFHTGDKSDQIFIIKQGKFSLLQAFSTQQPPGSPRKVLRRRIEVAVIGAGACLGEQEALEGRHRVYSCVCRTEIGIVWVIEKLVRSLSELFKSREKGKRRQFGG